jgi:hypothetical protein
MLLQRTALKKKIFIKLKKTNRAEDKSSADSMSERKHELF